MHLRLSPSSGRAAAGILVAGLLTACADNPTTPTRVMAPASSSSAVANAGNTYLVLARGNGFSSDFTSTVESLGGSVRTIHNGTGFAVIDGLSATAAATIGGMNGVADIEADETVAMHAPTAPVQVEAATDPSIQSVGNPTTAARYSWQWNMRAISADVAWAAGNLGDPGVTVAILDTGIDYDAPDLNGLVDLSRSTSFVASDNAIRSAFFPTRNNISDFNGHGTNVATQVSSKAVALAGVTSKTTLIGVKVLGADGTGSFGGILNGVLWAADHGADVANMSLGASFLKAGNGRFTSLLNRVFDYAKKSGMLVVVAAGNDSENMDHNGNETNAQCDMVHVVCVSAFGPATATGPVFEPAFYTNFGRSAVTVGGPGGNADAAHGFAVSAWPWGLDIASWVWSYCSKTTIAGFTATGTPVLTVCVFGNRLTGEIGTSQATPHVAGLAALLVAKYGHGRPEQIRNQIQQSAIDAGAPGTDPFFGRGRINVAKALGL